MPFVAPNFLSRRYRSRVLPSEWALILYCLGLIGVCSAFRARIPSWPWYAVGHAAVILAASLAAGARSSAVRFFRDWDMCLYIPVLFFLAGGLVHRVHPVDYDESLLAVDRAIGGVAVLRWMRSIERPGLTLLAKGAWIGYYFLPFLPGIALYRRPQRRDFEEAKLLFMLGWLLTYVGYFLLPAQGPGYFEERVGVPQPAWDPATSKVKEWIHALEGEARDTFPSGHATIAALVVFVCLRNRAWTAAAAAVPLSLAVIGSTLYLRYHYLVDVLAGMVLAGFCALLGTWWYRRYNEDRVDP